MPFTDGEIRFTPTTAFEALAKQGIEPVQHLGREQTNTSVILGEALFLKAIAARDAGINPDMEIPRFLMQAGFGFIAPLAGRSSTCAPNRHRSCSQRCLLLSRTRATRGPTH